MAPSARHLGDLQRLRANIEGIDRALIALIGDRVRLARHIAVLKEADGLPLRDAQQEARVVRRAARLARGAGLPEHGVRRVFRQLIGLTRRAEARR